MMGSGRGWRGLASGRGARGAGRGAKTVIAGHSFLWPAITVRFLSGRAMLSDTVSLVGLA